jgi:nitrite reductase (NO-forming)
MFHVSRFSRIGLSRRLDMEDELPAVRQFVFFGAIMLLAIAAGSAVGVAIYGVPHLRGETGEGRVPTREPDEVIEISLQEWSIGAVPVNLRRGDVVEFVVRNNGTVAHNFMIDGTVGVPTMEPGTEESFIYGPVEDASVTGWCTILGHRQNGMEVTLEAVERPEPPPDGGPGGGGPPSGEEP